MRTAIAVALLLAVAVPIASGEFAIPWSGIGRGAYLAFAALVLMLFLFTVGVVLAMLGRAIGHLGGFFKKKE